MVKLGSVIKNYRYLVINKPWMLLIISILFTLILGVGLKGLSQNPDNRIFFKEILI